MATARIPRADVTYDIVIGVDGTPNLPGLIIAPGDWVEFTNNAPFPVQIVFFCANGPVFTNTTRINTNTTSTSQQSQQTEITTDYWVINLNNPANPIGPFSIEVGINPGTVPAPLSVPIVAGNPPTNPDMSNIAVPRGGWIQFHLDGTYNVTFNPSSSFTGPANPVSGNPIYHANTGNQNLTATYSLASVGGVVGGGSVHIHS